MSKKVKTLSAEDAQKLLNSIDRFLEPSNKGRADRESFQNIVDFGVRSHAATREELLKGTGLANNFFSDASKGTAPTVSSAVRSTTLRILRAKAAAVVGQPALTA